MLILSTILLTTAVQVSEETRPNRPQVSGIYPHLAMFNQENECGTGAVVPWAGSLWVITYAPHKPRGSSDKLYRIDADLTQEIRPESIGGTPANRMIHRESEQLFIGPYVIDADGGVRVIPYSEMLGRPTANARHLVDPAGMLYLATMEEGLYEIDVETLEVTEIFADTQSEGNGRLADLPGYHGKGLYSGQGRLIYANNGEYGAAARTDPTTPSGVLAEWPGPVTDGSIPPWQVVRRNQFTEVTGPGGIFGADNPAEDPVWALGWDHKSVLLEVLHEGAWHRYRLPKGSHSYDGAHGWNTEWPRIREIGADEDLLATMHGTFWRFPRGFRPGSTAGLRPRSNYLKVVGDFARWGEHIVFGCDDAAKSEFLNQRRAKGEIAGPGESQSNLWFVPPAQLDELGPSLGRGALWLGEDLAAGATSDPFLAAGYAYRGLHLGHRGAEEARWVLEVDRAGTGAFEALRTLELAAGAATWVDLSQVEAEWWRLRALTEIEAATAVFAYRDADSRTTQRDSLFDGLAAPGAWTREDFPAAGGLLHARGAGFRTLRMIAGGAVGDAPPEVYDLDGELRLVRKDDPKGLQWTSQAVAMPKDPGVGVDAASAYYVDDAGKRWRFPVGERKSPEVHRWARVAREVCTERDLFHVAGTFFELPAENAGGFAKIRPIATHDRWIVDFASYRGMLVLAGVSTEMLARVHKGTGNPHIVRSEDGRTGLWVGAVDDLWKLGKPRGVGGPWMDTEVEANTWSDPYLMTGYDEKDYFVRADQEVEFVLELDVSGAGDWLEFDRIRVQPDEAVMGRFPRGLEAYWLRARVTGDCQATLRFSYH